MILAAGRGERMRPLTDSTPKPLLQVRGKPLMQWPLEALARGGFARWWSIPPGWASELKIILAPAPGYCVMRYQIQSSMAITWSHEGRDFGDALETLGGICRALPLLDDIFWVLAGDVFAPDLCSPPRRSGALPRAQAGPHLAGAQPGAQPEGRFWPVCRRPGPEPGAGEIHLLHHRPVPRALFEAPWCNIPPGNPDGSQSPAGATAARRDGQSLITAELYTGPWTDVGTPERLAQLNTP
jgi:MurNAc alpha-1-phosphate uridylyltransferase